MQSNNKNITNKESFKLLQLSDDSKSLSDLELPELANQRKRKVRRKTRPKTTPQHSRQHTQDVVQQTCKNLGLWIAIFMTCGWLFILSYLMAVIHAGNQNLALQLQILSSSSQNIPNELQKWHETSKTLEQNQTAMYTKIMDIQQRMDNFENELTQMKDVMKVKTENSDNMKLMSLEKNVADFGANIKDIKIDVDKLKENVHNLQEIELINRNNLDNLTIKFETVVNNTASITPLTIFNHNNDTHEILNNINKTFMNDYKNLSIQLFTINDTLNQKIKGLEVDLYKTKVDKLIDDFANMSSHVITIENDWSTYKQKSIDFEKTYLAINSELLNIKNTTKSLMADLYDFKIDINAKMHNLSAIAIQKMNNIDNVNVNKQQQQQQQEQQQQQQEH